MVLANCACPNWFFLTYGVNKSCGLDCFHVDDSKVTLNVCLGKQFSGGELFLWGVRCEDHVNTETQSEEILDYSHVPGHAVLHYGRHRHGARPIKSGHRINLLLRCRSIVKVVWVPPEYGGGVACICADGTFSLWKEVAEDTKPLQWKLCKGFETSSNQVLDMQFGVLFTSLKLVAAYSNGHVKVYELLDPLELKNWQLQAEFQNVIDSTSNFAKAACLSASISWTPQRGDSQQLSFVLGFNSNVMQLNFAKNTDEITKAIIGTSNAIASVSAKSIFLS
ncbi:Protein SEH1 [Camellia lanceoleosa]|uniref:Protein SEH1 n=1 Tax=Camellia lanceoleosa TaxID=1840588 RepID=A0ACC0HN32_9ERIC|nr:Protein SEH1 [Camellia lanceoleosa]